MTQIVHDIIKSIAITMVDIQADINKLELQVDKLLEITKQLEE